MMKEILAKLPKEVIYYSLIPVLIIILIDGLLYFLVNKNKDNGFRFSMLIKLSMIVTIAIVLPLIVGYTVWIIEKLIGKGILLDKIGYVLLIIFLCIMLLVLIFWVFKRTLKYLDEIKSAKKNKVSF